MDEKDAVYRIALAGLLHDIGKFAQRAGWKAGAHPQVGGDFVCKFVPQPWREGLYPVMGHHDRPLQGYETKVVALADRLSAGERIPTEEEGPRQLRSIFCALRTDDQSAPEKYWPLSSLRMDEQALFPGPAMGEEAAKQAYSRLWEDFSTDAAALRDAHQSGENLPVYLESLLLLLQRYTWCVPSAYWRALPDVSLYDHSRTTAALAICLWGQAEEATVEQALDALEKWYREREKDRSAPVLAELERMEVALLVGGDISGVQDFIYTITARGATSALRGRSFYLQLLTEAVARYVLRRLGLPITNLIYQGGGGFYLLARPSDRDRLEEVRREVSRILLAHHRGDLYLALEAVPLAAADFYDGRISGKWEALAESLRKAKQHRFAELGNELTVLFQPEGHGGDQERECQVCGREHPGTKKDDDVQKCPPCRSYEDLGDSLRRARYLWMAETKPSVPGNPLEVPPGGWEEVLAAFGMRAGAVENLDRVPLANGLRWILALKDQAMANLRPDARTIVGRRLLVNVTPILSEKEHQKLRGEAGGLPKPGSVKPFEAMAHQSRGIRRLGVLRMDVDDLGKLFSEGFGGNATLSRVAALSFAISLFFEGWVEVLAEHIGRDEEGQERLYSIYSGGDDLFFVGSWDAVVELARAIRADFARFTAHPGVHASAGIALVGGKYPLYQAAEEAGSAEKRAKDLRWRDGEGKERRKDAVCFLGQALPWYRFGLEEGCPEGMQSVHALAHLLERLTRARANGGAGAPKALLQMLIRLQEQHQEAAEARRLRGEDRSKTGEEQVYYGPWMWRGYYFLKRMARRYEKSDPEVARAVDELTEQLHGDGFRAIEWIGLAARWAELLGRD